MLYNIVFQFTHDKLASFLIALVLALNPSLFLYEAYILYALVTAFWVTLSLFFLSLFSSKKKLVYLYAFVLTLNLLILTRSIYHPIILLVGIPIACILASNQWKRVLVISVFVSLLSIGWYAKNYSKFGFFGGSSWGGLNLWRIAFEGYTEEQLDALVEENVIESTVAHILVFNKPSKYLDHGFNAMSDIDVLSRNDYNNVNVIEISKMYQRNALSLISHDPVHYLETVFKAYVRYTRSSSRFGHFHINAAKFWVHEAISSQVIQGQALAWLIDEDEFGIFLFFLLPASMLGYVVALIQTCGTSTKNWLHHVQLY